MGKEAQKRLLHVILLFAVVFAACTIIYLLDIPCLILDRFGIYCTACGTQRMVRHALSLDFAGAFRQNQFMFIALPLVMLFCIYQAVCYVRKGVVLKSRWEKGFLFLLLVTGIAFMVIRNLPLFQVLQPF